MIKICPKCGKEFTHKRNKCCSLLCSRRRVHSLETKQNLSKIRKNFLIENPDKHHWRTKEKHKSEPCERVKEYLRSLNIVFVEEWQPLTNFAYSLDIAFPDFKLAIEINGNQHYNSDGSLKEYYQRRHDLIEQNGWTILELHYTVAYDLNKLLLLIGNREQPDYSEYFKIQLEKQMKRNKELPMRYGQKQKIKNDLKWEPFKEIILNSGIDFSKFGWVQKVSKILGISTSKISKWMKRYLPDFY